jgi:hypothetical protein
MPVWKFKWELEICTSIPVGNDVGGSGRGLTTRYAVPGVKLKGWHSECKVRRNLLSVSPWNL